MRRYLKIARFEKGMNQRVAAKRLNIPIEIYQYFEDGKIMNPLPLWVAVKISEVFGLSIDYIESEESKRNEKENEESIR